MKSNANTDVAKLTTQSSFEVNAISKPTNTPEIRFFNDDLRQKTFPRSFARKIFKV